MLKGFDSYDTFVVVINFLGLDWQPQHIMINLFEVTNFT
jgi:hypothetical protein